MQFSNAVLKCKNVKESLPSTNTQLDEAGFLYDINLLWLLKSKNLDQVD